MKPELFLLGDPAVYHRYAAAAEATGGRVVFSGDIKDCQGLLLPGGGDIDPECYGQENHGSRSIDLVRDQREWDLLAQFLATGKPVLGICRGLQVVNVFFGGTLYQDIPGHSSPEGDFLHTVVTRGAPFDALFPPGSRVNSAHHQAVELLGEGLQPVQWSEDGVVEALIHQTKPVWCVQWHPERMEQWGAAGGAGQRLLEAFFTTFWE